MGLGEETADGSLQTAEDERRSQPGVVVVFSGGKILCLPLPVGEGPLVLGRTPGSAAVVLPDERLSRSHATISRNGADWVVRDCGSRNGTFVDGEPVRGSITVANPRVFRLADTLILPVPDVLALAEQRASTGDDGAVVGVRLRQALTAVKHAAGASATLVIQGESGSGKELAARTFHAAGPHASGPFVAVNCAAIPEGLAERLLFGTMRGAYSGAAADAQGHLQAADRGVLFLDEVGDLELQVQAKLLRALETREVVPLGSSSGQRVNVRVCVATHRDLRAAVAAGRFRADLYYRLAPPDVTMPPLRERLDEFPRHVMGEIASVSKALSPHVRLVEACMLRAWPGNVRELRKEIHHAAARALRENGELVRLEHLSPTAGCTLVPTSPPAPTTEPPATPERATPAKAVSAPNAPKRKYVRWGAAITREQIEQALTHANGSIAVAARSLSMHRAQFYREMARWSVPIPADEASRE